MKRYPVITISIMLLAADVWLSPALRELAIFERTHIAHGEWWRLLTGHLVHFSFSHLAFDLIVFGVTAWLIEREQPGRLLGILIASALTVSVALFWLSPHLQFYGGLSGVASATLCYLALRLTQRRGAARALGVLTLLLVIIKLAGETGCSQPTFATFASPDIQVASVAHVAGALTGMLVWLWDRLPSLISLSRGGRLGVRLQKTSG